MISGMLTAIQDFLSDSFAEGGHELETVDMGRFKLWMGSSPKLLLVGAVGGTAPVELRKVFRKALDRIEAALQSQIDNFKQDDSAYSNPRGLFSRPVYWANRDRESQKARLWPYLAAIRRDPAGALSLASQDAWPAGTATSTR